MAGQPKAPFYFAVFVVVAGLVAFAAYRASRPAPKVVNQHGDDGPQITSPSGGGSGGGEKAEAPDAASITTVKEYTFRPSERLPAVKGTAAYQKMENNTVRFALNVWAGWAP